MSLHAGLQLKQEGQRIVSENEREQWRSAALALLREFAVANHFVRADEFDTFRKSKNLSDPHHPNVIGTLFSTAASNGWLVKTDNYGVSTKTEARAHSYVVWRSLLCQSEPLVGADYASEDKVFHGIRAPGCGGWFFDTESEAVEAVGHYAKRLSVPRKEIEFFTLFTEGKAAQRGVAVC